MLNAILLGLAWLFGCFRDHLGGDLHERCHDADDGICAHVARALKQLTGCSGQDGQVAGTRPHSTRVRDFLHIFTVILV